MINDYEFCLMCVKDGLVYPVMLTQEQNQMLQMYVMALGKINVLNKPQGVAEKLTYGRAKEANQ